MGRRSPLSLLLLVLLVFGYGPRPSLAKCTPTNPIEVYEGEKVISAEDPGSSNKVYVTFFVLPSSGVQRVNLTATAEGEIDGRKQTVLFSHLIEADDKCFEKDQWMKVSMWADLSKDHTLGFRVGNCRKECRTDLGTATTGKLTLRWLNVTARGRSKWAKKVSGRGCVIKQLGQVDRPSNVPNCKEQTLEPAPSSTQTTLQPPPSSTQTTLQPPSSSNQTTLQPPSSSQPHTSTSTQLFSLSKAFVVAIVVVVSVVVVTGPMLVLIEVYVRKKRRRNATVTDAAASSTHTVVRENCTYEASNDQHTAVGDTARVIENEIYEPFSNGGGAAGRTRTTEVIENELYEPLSYGQSAAGGTTEVKENELYEPFSYGKSEACGTTEVNENKLYEPFSYTETPVGGRAKIIFKNVVEGGMEEDSEDHIYEIL